MGEAAKEIGFDVRPLPYSEWRKLLLDDVAATPSEKLRVNAVF